MARNLMKEILTLQECKPFEVVESNEEKLRLQGKIHIFRSTDEFILDKEYLIEVIIPRDERILPSAIDIGSHIDSSFEHKYSNGELCLETECIIMKRFAEGMTILEWFEDFVEPFYFSYEYFSTYGTFPFDERSHGIVGIIEGYTDIFKTENQDELINILFYVRANGKYRGHTLCPCGSEKKLRNCHGEVILPFYTHPVLRDILIKDVNYIEGEVVRAYAARNNKKTE